MQTDECRTILYVGIKTDELLLLGNKNIETLKYW